LPLQEIISTLLYYGRAINSNLLTAFGTLASAQTNDTKATANACKQLLNYCATPHPDAVVRFQASDMRLHIDSDASYLPEPKVRSPVGGIFYLSTIPLPTPAPNDPDPPLNGAVHVVSNILRNVMSSAAKAKSAASSTMDRRPAPSVKPPSTWAICSLSHR
jgi:hypothetical protein